MAELLKNMFNYYTLSEVGRTIQAVYPSFPVEEFLASTMDETWEDLELKARVRKISMSLGKYLPADYNEALGVLDRVVIFRNYISRLCRGVRPG